MKKVLAVLMTVVTLVTALCFAAFADDDAIKVMLDGNYIEFDVSPTIVEGRTLVPVRAIFEKLGASIEWIEETRTVISKYEDTEICLTIDDKILYKNGTAVTLDVPAQLIESRTLVPIRAISEAFNCAVFWNQWDRSVVIYSNLDDVAVGTVDGENISASYFNFVLNQVEYATTQSLGIPYEEIPALWNTPIQNDLTFGEYLTDLTLEQCQFLKSNVQKAKAIGVELSSDEILNIDDSLKPIVDSYGNDYEAVLKNSGTTMTAVKEFYTDNTYLERYYDFLCEKNSMTEIEAKKYLDENYIRAKHILFATVDKFTGAPLSAEEKAEKRKLAESTLSKIKKGTDFDKLMEELSEDPGSKTSPEGYLFTKGEMVPEFEDAAYALKVGSTSEIVESTYGYHIIRRVKNGEYDEETLALAYSQSENKVAEIMNTNMASAETTLNDNIYSNIIPF